MGNNEMVSVKPLGKGFRCVLKQYFWRDFGVWDPEFGPVKFEGDIFFFVFVFVAPISTANLGPNACRFSGEVYLGCEDVVGSDERAYIN